ncbi:MAG: hypothetical protein ABW019_00495 [Chitinophagaceae bacterium]
MGNNQIIIYQAPDGRTSVDVVVDQDSVWLDQERISTLFQTDRTSIMIAESKPNEKEVMVQVVVNLINDNN